MLLRSPDLFFQSPRVHDTYANISLYRGHIIFSTWSCYRQGSKLPGRSAVFNVAIMVLNNLIKPIFRFLCALVFITKGPIMLIASEDYSVMRLLGIWAPIEVRFFGSLAFLIPAELTGNPI